MTVEVTMEQVYQLIGELFVENKMRATIQEKQKAQLIAYAQELVKARDTLESFVARPIENEDERLQDEIAKADALVARKKK